MTDSQVLRIDRTEESENKRSQYVVLAQCTVELTIHATGAVYAETAAASQTGPQIGEVTDFAIKTASSDALKRCATYLGTQFGLSLYRGGQTVVYAPEQYRVPPPAHTPEQVQAMVERATTPPQEES